MKTIRPFQRKLRYMETLSEFHCTTTSLLSLKIAARSQLVYFTHLSSPKTTTPQPPIEIKTWNWSNVLGDHSIDHYMLKGSAVYFQSPKIYPQDLLIAASRMIIPTYRMIQQADQDFEDTEKDGAQRRLTASLGNLDLSCEIPSFQRWQEILCGLTDDEDFKGQSLDSDPLIHRVTKIW